MAKINFTAGRVSGFQCPEGKAQAFLWDTGAPGLGLRVTPNGQPAYVFQSVYEGKTIRQTIGSPNVWTIDRARVKARELQTLIDSGRDPRAVKAEVVAADKAALAAVVADGVTVGQAWTAYLDARRLFWSERTYRDHEALSKAGGEPAKRGTKGRGVTVPGPIYPLLALRLVELTPEAVEAWAAREGRARPTYGRLALRCLKAFLNWCTTEPDYKTQVQDNPAQGKKVRESFGRAQPKKDALMREQLPAWFMAVRNINNPVVSAALQAMLLTGARENEILSLRWEDVNARWKGLTIRDKVEGERVIPLTPYVHSLIDALPRRNEWVFSSTRAVKMDASNVARRSRRSGTDSTPIVQTSSTGYISVPRNHHVCACQAAGIEGLTLHGLRRSFKSLTEWLDIPAGVVAQIMGHKPSATAEKHYTVRPLDLLRIHHERIEAWMLEQAGVAFGSSTAVKPQLASGIAAA